MKLSDLRKPTQVRTRKYGTLTLRRLSIGDSAFIQDLKKNDLSTVDVIARILDRQLSSPPLDLDIIRAWDKRLLKRVARLWVEGEIKRQLPATAPTLDEIVNALYSALDKQSAEVRQSIRSLRDVAILPGIDVKSNPPIYGIAAGRTALDEWNKRSSLLFGLSQTAIDGLPPFLLKSVIDEWDAVKGWVQPEVGKIFASGIIDKLLLSEASKIRDWITDVSRLSPLLSAMESTFAIERRMSGVDVSSAWRKPLIGSFFGMNEAYNTFLSNLTETSPKLLFAYPDVLRLSAWEVFNTGDVIETVFLPTKSPITSQEKQQARDEVSADIDASLPSLLLSLNEDLCKMWQGAKEALTSKNPDRIRHYITSLRELFTHVLHLLSPDKEVRKWSSLPSHYHNNSPTREARLVYICRGISDDDLGVFIQNDVDSMEKMFKLFNKGTHGITPGFTDDELRIIGVRVDGILRYLIQISRTE